MCDHAFMFVFEGKAAWNCRVCGIAAQSVDQVGDVVRRQSLVRAEAVDEERGSHIGGEGRELDGTTGGQPEWSAVGDQHAQTGCSGEGFEPGRVSRCVDDDQMVESGGFEANQRTGSRFDRRPKCVRRA